MKTPETLFRKDFYQRHLSKIREISFTPREIDVIACLLNLRGTSKIASILLIGTRGVESQIRNIMSMSKIGCNSREGIIDFVESSGKVHLFRRYYALLKINCFFENALTQIAKLAQKNQLKVGFISDTEDSTYITHLKQHLTLAGFNVLNLKKNDATDYLILAFSSFMDATTSALEKTNRKACKKILFLYGDKLTKKLPSSHDKNTEIICLKNPESYYVNFFKIIKSFLPEININLIEAKFLEEYKKLLAELKHSELPDVTLKKKGPFFYYSRYATSSLFLFIILIFSYSTYNWLQYGKEPQAILSDLALPKLSLLLDRQNLIDEIDIAFEKAKSDIKTIAIVGPGGAGKTTLARVYAKQLYNVPIWEINAETKESLNLSFEVLDEQLATSEDDKKELRVIKEIKVNEERQRQLVKFARDHLKTHPNWVLIYDNVEKFLDIQDFFPKSSDLWGTGKVILTTRNLNIQNNNSVDQVIQIGELTDKQKRELFNKIFEGHKRVFESETLNRFLHEIPPYPLDVSVAAYYVKSSNIDLEDYLKKSISDKSDFFRSQESLLKEIGDYEKTRQQIITLSLEKIIGKISDYRDLLLFICLVDSQNIPKEMLYKLKNPFIVDNFLNQLRKFSLLTHESEKFSLQTFSLHRSTQIMSLNHLKNISRISNTNISAAIDALINYAEDIEKEYDDDKIFLLILHFERFLKHKDLLSDLTYSKLLTKLGSLYLHTAKEQHGEKLIKIGIKTLSNVTPLPKPHLAYAYYRLGGYYWAIGNLNAAVKCFQLSLKFYDSRSEKDRLGIASSYIGLGTAYDSLGQLPNAESAFSRVFKILDVNHPEGFYQKAFALANLAHVYQQLGLYTKSFEKIQESIAAHKHFSEKSYKNSYKSKELLGYYYSDIGEYQKAYECFRWIYDDIIKYYPKVSRSVAWASRNLGLSYYELKQYDKATSLLEHSVYAFKTVLGAENIKTLWAQTCLAEVYRNTGRTREAKKIFYECLIKYRKEYGKEHIQVARIMRHLGQTYFTENNLLKAEEFIKAGLNISRKKAPYKSYLFLEDLSSIYFAKANAAKNEKQNLDFYKFKDISISYLQEALKIMTEIFPEEAPRLKEVKSQLVVLQELRL